MHFIQKNTRRYLLTGAIFILMIFAACFQMLGEHAYYSLCQERFRAVERNIAYVCGTLDYLVAEDGNWDQGKYLSALKFIVERVDETPNVYAVLMDAHFEILSTQIILDDDKWSFDKDNHPDLLEAMLAEETGSIVVMSEPFDAKLRPAPSVPVHLCWRWIPTGRQHENKVLCLVGITKHAVDTHLADWTAWCVVALLTVTAIFIVFSIMLLTVDRRKTIRG